MYTKRADGKGTLLGRLDYILLFLYLTLVIAGWLTIYAASYDVQLEGQLLLEGRIKGQLTWMLVSFITGGAILLVDPSFYRNVAPILYGGLLLLLVATIFLAPDIKGSHSWLIITNSIRLQPAEFAKVTTALMLAWWCQRYDFDIEKPREIGIAFLWFLLPMSIIVLQSETGSALVFLVFVLVLYREGLTSAVHMFGIYSGILFVLTLGMSGRVYWDETNALWLTVPMLVYGGLYLSSKLYCPHLKNMGWGAIAIAPTCFLLWGVISFFRPVNYAIPSVVALILYIAFIACQSFTKKSIRGVGLVLFALLSIGMQSGVTYFFDKILQPHQQTRILVSLGLKDEPWGAGYNVHQSLIAIGSGGFYGKGYLHGTQTKLSYVPEQDTDFIFCTIGEEWGFLGSSCILLLYFLFFLRIIYIAERQPDRFSRIYGYSVACILFFHLMINVGMVLGLVPVIGIPLPYFSYGGSSLLSFTILLFILLRLDASRTVT